MRFLCSKEELTEKKICDFLQKFEQYELPRLNRYKNYYDGKQDILRRVATDPNKPCNKIVTNYCSQIVDNYLGYLVGQEVSYISQDDISDIMAVLAYNDSKTADTELLKQALIYGRAYEINYVDEDSQQRFKYLDSREIIAIHENNIEESLLAVVRFYAVDIFDATKGCYVDVYTDKTIAHYKSRPGFSSLEPLGEEAHYYGQVPITEFSLNQEEYSIFDKILTLQDSYNLILSTATDDYEAFSDYYMVIKGAQGLTQDDLINMKQNRVVALDNTDDDVNFISPVQLAADTSVRLKDIEEQIHKISNSPDFADDAFGTSSGIAMQYKLLGFENTAGAIAANMTKALQKRLELICGILAKVNGDYWRDIEILFTRNLPTDYATLAQLITQLKGTVSDKTLLGLLPFISDVDKELELVNQTKLENMELYGFGGSHESEEDAETTGQSDRDN